MQKPQPLGADRPYTAASTVNGRGSMSIPRSLGGRVSRSARRSRCSRRWSSAQQAGARRRGAARPAAVVLQGGMATTGAPCGRGTGLRPRGRRHGWPPSRIRRSSSSSTIRTRRASPATSRIRRRARSRATGAAPRACSSRATTRIRRRSASRPANRPTRRISGPACATRRSRRRCATDELRRSHAGSHASAG